MGLGVLMEKDNTVKQAGGFIVQLMPSCGEDVIAVLEENIGRLKSVTTMFEEGLTPWQMLQVILEGLEPEQTDTMEVRFHCNCDKKRVEKALVSIGREELESMIAEGRDIEVNCHFCNTNYTFTVEELKALCEQ